MCNFRNLAMVATAAFGLMAAPDDETTQRQRQLGLQTVSAGASCRITSPQAKLPKPVLKPPASTEPGSARMEPLTRQLVPLDGASLADTRMTNLQPTGCSPAPPNRSIFSATDGAAFQWLSMTGVSSGDTIEWDFIAPDGSTYSVNNYVSTFSGTACFWGGIYIAGYQAAGLPGDWQVKALYNGHLLVTSSFTIAAGSGGSVCRNELSVFFSGGINLGNAWERPQDPSGYPQPSIVSLLMIDLATAKSSLGVIPCIPFDYSEFDNLAGTIGSLSANDASSAVVTLIQRYQAAIGKAALTCDLKVDLVELFIAGVHLGGAGSRASLTLCTPIPPVAQADINSHMAFASAAVAAYKGCAFAIGTIPTALTFSPDRPYDAFGTIVAIQEQVLWNVALSDCCCICGK